jgi:hypothetical protein
MSKLKPCPFCGGKVSITYSSWNKTFNIWHNDKPCALIEPIQIDGSKAKSLAEASEMWNRRTKT